jgi:hypothetical protein
MTTSTPPTPKLLRTGSASFAVATVMAGSVLSATVAAPLAQATPIDDLRGAVNDARARTSCSPLNYSGQLEGFAQHFVRGGNRSLDTGYAGETVYLSRRDDPTSKATEGLLADNGFNIANCAYKDVGVGMIRYADVSVVGVVLGIPRAPAAPPPPPPPPAQPAQSPQPAQPAQPAPAAEPAPAPPVTNAIALSFGAPGLGSITATVTNSSGLTGKCTYDASGLAKTHRDFTVGPNASTNLTFNGLNTGASYHVVVSCHDASGKQTQEIGHAEQNVTF